MRKMFLILIAVIASFSMVTLADARPRHYYKSKLLHTDLINVNIAQNETQTLSAKRRSRGGGSCDGVHRCICGTTAARRHGLPVNYNGHNLAQAVQWKYAFQHTSLAVGTVMYRHGAGPTGHVSTVVALNGGCNITVEDERGQHPDSACGRGNVFLAVNGGGGYSTPQYASNARGKKQQYTQVAANYSGFEWGQAH